MEMDIDKYVLSRLKIGYRHSDRYQSMILSKTDAIGLMLRVKKAFLIMCWESKMVLWLWKELCILMTNTGIFINISNL